jgi:hypothetical protein
MYKSIFAFVVMLAALALTSGSKSADASPATPNFPVIVAKAKLLDQGEVNRAIFTPTKTGLYRLSIYVTFTTPDPLTQSLYLSMNWTDDAGVENAVPLLFTNSGTPPDAYMGFGTSWPGNVSTFEAVAGSPITLSAVTPIGNARFNLYYVVENLE